MIEDIVKVIVDRPLGSQHPQYKETYYPINYGFVEGIMAEDEEEQDKFFKENAVTAKCHAYLRHLNDHFSRESFRAASGRIKRSGQKEESGQGKDI